MNYVDYIKELVKRWEGDPDKALEAAKRDVRVLELLCEQKSANMGIELFPSSSFSGYMEVIEEIFRNEPFPPPTEPVQSEDRIVQGAVVSDHIKRIFTALVELERYSLKLLVKLPLVLVLKEILEGEFRAAYGGGLPGIPKDAQIFVRTGPKGEWMVVYRGGEQLHGQGPLAGKLNAVLLATP